MRLLAVGACLFYGLARFTLIALTSRDYGLALQINILCWITVLLLLLLIYILRGKDDLQALGVPLLLFCSFTAGALYMRDFRYYFLVCLGISGLACLYRNLPRLTQFYLTANAVVLVLLLTGLFALDPEMDVAVATACWIIFLCSAALLLALTSRAAGQTGAADRAFRTFATLMNTTPNLIAIVDGHNRVVYISKALAKFANISDPESVKEQPIYALFRDAAMQAMIGEVLAVDGFHDEAKEIILEGEPRFFRWWPMI
jgi:PAS domain-containing protein